MTRPAVPLVPAAVAPAASTVTAAAPAVPPTEPAPSLPTSGRASRKRSSIAKPALQLPFERGEISRDVFKQILRKVAEKVVKGYQLEGLPAPKPSELPAKQVGKIEKLAHEYVVLLKKA